MDENKESQFFCDLKKEKKRKKIQVILLLKNHNYNQIKYILIFLAIIEITMVKINIEWISNIFITTNSIDFVLLGIWIISIYLVKMKEILSSKLGIVQVYTVDLYETNVLLHDFNY